MIFTMEIEVDTLFHFVICTKLMHKLEKFSGKIDTNLQ